jgi:hypothetical protein
MVGRSFVGAACAADVSSITTLASMAESAWVAAAEGGSTGVAESVSAFVGTVFAEFWMFSFARASVGGEKELVAVVSAVCAVATDCIKSNAGAAVRLDATGQTGQHGHRDWDDQEHAQPFHVAPRFCLHQKTRQRQRRSAARRGGRLGIIDGMFRSGR